MGKINESYDCNAPIRDVDNELPYAPPLKGAIPKLEAQRAAREHVTQVHNAQLKKASFTYTREGAARPK
jgi:hypothetical protein